MRHRHKGKIIDRKYAARKALIKHLAESFILYETIQTTTAKAKVTQPFVEKLVTIAKEPTLTNRRKLLELLGSRSRAVAKILEVIAPRYKNVTGGVTRRILTARRQGDNAQLMQLSFIEPRADKK